MCPAKELIVAPDGNDTNPGTAARPLATLDGARSAVRQLLAGGDEEDISVLFRGGTYVQHAPVVFGPEDSARGKQVITYAAFPGETPVFTGGRRITGWQQNGRIWTATIPEAKEGKWIFRRLYVDAQQRTLARTPDAGSYFRVVADVATDPNAFEYKPADLPRTSNLTKANIVGLMNWETYILPISAVDSQKHIIQFSRKPTWPFARGIRYFFENFPEALDAPGEWYLDRIAGILSYIPRDGEDMTKEVVTAPVAGEFIRITGDAGQDRPVRGLVFRGLHFRHTDEPLGEKGHGDLQAAESVPAIITFASARNCAIERCEIACTGGYAIEVAGGCDGVRIEQNELHDLGAGGVKVRTGSRATTINNNFIHEGGGVFQGGPGVLVQDSSDNVITHNEVADFDWMGICVGWSWGFQPTHCHNNKIEYNHLHHLGRGQLTDIAAIYTLGISTGTTIRNNLIHHVWDWPEGYLACGIYPDEGSTGLLIENNVVYQTSWGGFHCHYGRDNIVRNNIFAFGRSAQVHMGRGKGPSDGDNWAGRTNSSMTFERNIVLYDQGNLWMRDSELTADHNLYWNTAGPVFFAKSADLAAWQKRGYDAHGTVADPLFVDPANGDFTLRPTSPALALGFIPIDTSQAGLVGDAEWVARPKQIKRAAVVIPPYRQPDQLEAIDDGFEDYQPGAVPRYGTVSGAQSPEGASIRVTDETAATGKHSLKFQDAAGLKNAYDPHLYYNVGSASGVAHTSFDVRHEKGAIFYTEWRDWSVTPYITGPSLWFAADGVLSVQGKPLATLPPGKWVHIDISCSLGKQAGGTYRVAVTLPGQSPRVFENLICDKRFNKITWLGFSSMATESTNFYLDNLKFAAKP